MWWVGLGSHKLCGLVLPLRDHNFPLVCRSIGGYLGISPPIVNSEWLPVEYQSRDVTSMWEQRGGGISSGGVFPTYLQDLVSHQIWGWIDPRRVLQILVTKAAISHGNS